MSEVISNPKFEYDNFITEKMTNFWNRVSNKRGIEVILNLYIEMNTVLLRKLYQINSEMSLQDIVPFNIRSGMIIKLDKRESTYSEIKVPSDNEEYIKNIPKVYSNIRYPKIEYTAGEDYEVIRKNEETYIDFSEGNPEILRTDETGTEGNPYIYFPVAYTEDQRVYKNYGRAVGLEPETIEGVEGEEDEFYRNGVQALWKAMYTGPTISSIRQSMYVLHGLPFNQESGVIEDLNRVSKSEDGQPSIIVNGQVGRNAFKLHLIEDDIVDIDDSGTDIFLGFDVSNKNIKNFIDIHQVNLIDKNTIEEEGVYIKKLDKSLFKYDRGSEVLYIESSLIERGLSISIDGNYILDSSYNVFKRDPSIDSSISRERNLEGDWIRVFYNHRKQGEIREYDLPDSLTIHSDIEIGDFLSKFTLFSDQLEIQDYAADGSTRGEAPGKRAWAQNLLPFGQFSIRSGEELDVKTVLDDVTEFVDFLKPAYSDYTFELQINPTNAHVLGRITEDEILINMVEETEKSVINLGDLGKLTKAIYNSIIYVGDQKEQNSFDPVPMWDQKEYYDELISDVLSGNVDFEEDFYTNEISDDSHIEHIYNQGFYNDLQFWDRGAVEAQTKSEAKNLADDLHGITWEEIYYPPEHDLGKLVLDESESMAWDIGHIDGDQIVAWDDKSIKFDQGVDDSDSEKVLPDYDSDKVTWEWDKNNVDDVVANRSPFTYMFDIEGELADLGPVLPGLWDDVNIFYDLREIFLNN